MTSARNSRSTTLARSLRGAAVAAMAFGLAVSLSPAIASADPASISPGNVFNFRDIGGAQTQDGRTVRSGLVYRSGDMSGMTPQDHQTLLDGNVTTVIDLRDASERQDKPDVLPGEVYFQVADVLAGLQGGQTNEPLPITLGHGLFDVTSGGTNLQPSTFGLVGEAMLYPVMTNLHSANAAYGELLRTIATTNGATVFHCTAGKDRTGWGSAILLTVLGVSRDGVNADFLATNDAFGNPDAAQTAWLNASFNAVDRIYGDFDTYVRDGLGIDQGTLDALKAKLLK
ncbi:tyrosine-protein phosphatase [Tomitella biformata]|uniref:tyrosine-protein phosphatase n=1 Tax=Tomitella biformata TaxID=630403 RepID=UPI000466F27E|nr:tyrosine-protein phosphatase [Tomitella biformata]